MPSDLTIYTDFKTPGAYLALQPTLALARRYGLVIDWKPFRAQERAIPAERHDETRGETHRRVRAIQWRETDLLYAGVQGIEMKFREMPGETDLALAVLLQIPDNPLPFILKAFEAYWVDQLDLNERETVAWLLQDAGFGHVEPDLEALEAHQVDAEETGIIGAPAYVVGEHIFLGRQHLPWIEELVTEKA